MTSAGPGLRSTAGSALALARCCEHVFPARPEQVGVARRFVAGCWGTPPSPTTRSCVSRNWPATVSATR